MKREENPECSYHALAESHSQQRAGVGHGTYSPHAKPAARFACTLVSGEPERNLWKMPAPAAAFMTSSPKYR
jgi:hypothetical protein